MLIIIYWVIGIILSLIAGIGIASIFSGMGIITFIIGAIIFFGVLSIFVAGWIGLFAGNALFNLATQHKRDEEILEELKKMNEEKLSKD